MRDVWAASASSVFAVGSQGSIEHWNGSTWTPMTTGTQVEFGRVWGRGATDVYALGAGLVFHYDGVSWTQMPLPQAALALDLWGAPDDLFVATQDGVLRFDGAQWSPIATGTPFTVTHFAGVGDSLFFSDERGGVHQLLRLTDW
jgi:hypothetical protein